jgi:uncharacterized protein YegL
VFLPLIEGSMDMESNLEQRPFGNAEFAENPENRCPVLLLLDTSGSMQGPPITELNEGLQLFRDELFADSLAAKRVEVSIVSFGPVKVQADFTGIQYFQAPTLAASGDTPMGAAIEQGLELLQRRKDIYKANGISHYRPWIFLITDGGPTDSVIRATQLVKEGEDKKKFMFYAVGVDNANMDNLKAIGVRDPVKLKGLRFRDLFQWLSASISSVSRSRPDETVPLTSPVGLNGWATTE